MLIKKAKISNIVEFLKNNDRTSIVMPVQSKRPETRKFTKRAQSFRPIKSGYSNNNLEPVKAISIDSERQTA